MITTLEPCWHGVFHDYNNNMASHTMRLPVLVMFYDYNIIRGEEKYHGGGYHLRVMGMMPCINWDPISLVGMRTALTKLAYESDGEIVDSP